MLAFNSCNLSPQRTGCFRYEAKIMFPSICICSGSFYDTKPLDFRKDPEFDFNFKCLIPETFW